MKIHFRIFLLHVSLQKEYLTPALDYKRRQVNFLSFSDCDRVRIAFDTFLYGDYGNKSTWLRCASVMTGRFPTLGFKVLLSILQQQMCKRWSVTYDVTEELPQLNLLKYVFALCHKSIMKKQYFTQ